MREGQGIARDKAKQLRNKMTKAEVVLWVHLRGLRSHGYIFRRQHPIDPYIADFAVLKGRLVIEVDGATHGSCEQIMHDRKRDAYMRSKGWRVIRVLNSDIYENVNSVVEFILSQIPLPSASRSRAQHPPPPLAGEDSAPDIRKRKAPAV